MSPPLQFIFGMALALGGALFLWRLFRWVGVVVHDEETVLVTRFGKLAAVLSEPGCTPSGDALAVDGAAPRLAAARLSREIDNIQINDATGTTVIVDLWLEFRIENAERAAFAVQDWERSLRNVASHATRAILSNLDFGHILKDRTDLGERLKNDLRDECERWGCVYTTPLSATCACCPRSRAGCSRRSPRAKSEPRRASRKKVAWPWPCSTPRPPPAWPSARRRGQVAVPALDGPGLRRA